jgi:hypothetical protein
VPAAWRERTGRREGARQPRRRTGAGRGEGQAPIAGRKAPRGWGPAAGGTPEMGAGGGRRSRDGDRRVDVAERSRENGGRRWHGLGRAAAARSEEGGGGAIWEGGGGGCPIRGDGAGIDG